MIYKSILIHNNQFSEHSNIISSNVKEMDWKLDNADVVSSEIVVTSI